MKNYKRPESVLVIIMAEDSGRVLMMRRKDDPDFWQSVTGSLELHEKAYATAFREIKEETGFTPQKNQLQDLSRSVIFEIFPHFRHRYAPDVTHCKEHWFKMVLSKEQTPLLTEHSDFRWMRPKEAADLTKSWSNSQAILEFAV
ncbi:MULTISPECIES: dihydroneopterin triphosphate diphosphatase [Providencia]|uniref:Type 2 dihydroneopterin triphosphate pyrophosphohydrolase n=1 Tax=Providencia heimbachae ATCC 35613 TaxID=1354272 RepID=A0A1B7K2P0_9GAMM|nr:MULTISPECIES: dihydroneopterin triphosphate diphosphatase [Providencia]MBP6121242.1 dihydroneopterin triphosphate diphosphatase [Providencia sp.]NIH22866.1 dihydroneopterin triphosphate diphosphatase [Providencia heimbachae]OAT54410.1 type 2 dihydroneopterin triphosphate pyrophosphohydrolase [Providencia heimbachae ATCC 35613]QCJ70262.1 dihydroneopterin triphosphate diphosphatase [Providencia heimbachae]SQH13460.1 Dihydroneopterin triphosphate pyrophosphatase [Providencia heimbachae]